MKLRIWFATGLLVFCSSLAVADDKKKAPEMSADEKVMMEAWMKASMPGDAHKLLDPMVGKWNARVTFYPPGGGEAMTSKGKAESRWVLGGRYIEQRFSGFYMGQPFTGIGYTGYDNVRKQYAGTWIDSMSTAIMNSTGSATDGGKNWAFTATHPDPMTGKDVTMEEKVTVVDKNKHIFEMWSPAPDGKLYKAMEIVYTRAKS